MANTTIKIPALIGGISQQPDEFRFANQCEDANNVLFSPDRGAEKRAGSEAVLGTDLADGSLNVTNPTQAKFVHWIERDAAERYVVLIDPLNTNATCVEAFSVGDANKASVTVSTPQATYLKAGSGPATERYAVTTIADVTLIANKQVTVALTGTAPSYTITGANLVDYSDLAIPPAGGDVGNFYRVLETALGYPAGVYEAISSSAAPYYERQPSESANNEINATTAPVRLNNTAVDTFTVTTPDWIDRLNGDTDVNPGPSFVGKEITDLVWWQNRLWVAAGEQVVSSRLGDAFNFWLDDWTNVTDADPVDIAVSSTGIADTQHMTPFSKALFVSTSGTRQVEVRGFETITPTTVNIVESTAYRALNTPPARLSSQLYFASSDGQFSKVYEYIYSEDQIAQTATEITEQVSQLLAGRVTQIESSHNEDMLFFRTDDNGYTIYVHTMYWSGDQKAMAAWAKWTFPVDTDIISMKVLGDYLFCLLRRDDKIWLEKILIARKINSTGLDWTIHMDRQTSLGGSYSAGSNLTTWTLPYEDTLITRAITEDGDVLSVTNNAGTTVTIPGDYSAANVVVGRPFDMGITLSKQYVRDNNNVVQQGRLMLRTMTVYHTGTGFYEIEVTARDRETKTYTFTAPPLGDIVIGGTRIEDGTFSARLGSDAERTTIVISSDSVLPVQLTTIELLANFIPGRRSSNR